MSDFKIVQIAIHPESERGNFAMFGVANDGTVWEYMNADFGRKRETEETYLTANGGIGTWPVGSIIYEMGWKPCAMTGLPTAAKSEATDAA